jgi:hypothetical protein
MAESQKRILNEKPLQTGGEEAMNITFNNNNFAVASSRNGAAMGMGKRWREETLREELRGMN